MVRSNRGSGEPSNGESRVYVAGVLALTDPGPAAAGVVVVDDRGRMLSHRAYYLGYTGRDEAAVRAFLAALRLVRQLDLPGPRFYVETEWLAQALTGARPLPEKAARLAGTLQELLAQMPALKVETIGPPANPARTVALAPLLQWLPERTRRAENLNVRRIEEGLYEVGSERQPGVVYRVRLPSPERVAAGERVHCECPDYIWRGIPCKHLLVVASEAGGRERLFYPQSPGEAGLPRGPAEAAPEEEPPPPDRT